MSTIILTEEQQFAYNEIGKHKSLFLNGAAGCGKSVIITEKIKNDQSDSFILCATTNKAASVLSEKLNTGVEVRTLHSVLGLKPVNDGATKNPDEILEFVFSTTAENNMSLIGQNLIIDESSMICSEMQNYLLKMLEHENIDSVTFVGDRYQLPCVKGDPFNYDAIDETINLTQVQRAKGDLLDYYNNLRNNVTNTKPFELYEKARLFNDYNQFVDYVKSKTESKIVITYTNEAAARYSKLVDSNNLYIGQECSALSHCSYKHTEMLERVNIRTNSMIEVLKLFDDYNSMQRAAIKEEYEFELPLQALKYDLKNISYAKIRNEQQQEIYISVWNGTQEEKEDLLLNTFTREYRKFQDSIISSVPQWIWNKHAKKDGYVKKLSLLEPEYTLAGHNKQHDLGYWHDFMAVTHALILRSKLVSTAHRAQGITVEIAAIDLDDLSKSNSKKLEYVALTRASKELVFYKGA